jgi:hypothetical protein
MKMSKRYWIVLVLSMVLKLIFVYSVPIVPEIGDETAHWRYIQEVKDTGHPLNHSEQWYTGNQTYQASNNPLYYYVNATLCSTTTEARWLSVLIAMLALTMFATVCYRYSMWLPFLFLAVLPASAIAVSKVGGDCWVYSIVLMMVYAYDKKSDFLLLLLIAISANLRVEGLFIGAILFGHLVWRWWRTGWKQITVFHSLSAAAAMIALIVAAVIVIDRMPLFISGHSHVDRTFDTFAKVSEPINQAFISLWFNYGIEQYFWVWFLLIPAVIVSWKFTKTFVLTARTVLKTQWAPMLIVLSTGMIFLGQSYMQNASNGRYLLNFVPWMAYVIYKDIYDQQLKAKIQTKRGAGI